MSQDDDDLILNTLFLNQYPESWKGNVDVSVYLSQLGSYGLDKLGKEPDRISEEKEAILEQTQDLVFSNYQTFLQIAQCSKEVLQDFNLVESRVDSVLDQLPAFMEECQTFSKGTLELNNRRNLNSLTLKKHSQILEILEIPQLMDTCVRNGYYDEALELASHVQRMERKHSNISIITMLANDVKESQRFMLQQLLQQLRSNIQLPVCLRIIGYIRRMGCFSEQELKVKFLQARDSWFDNIIQNIPTTDVYHHITKVIEVSRVHLFDIMTQYRAIFSDEEPIIPGIKGSGNSDVGIFHSWVLQKVSKFLKILEVDLQAGVSGHLDSLLGQCMYFGLSLGRVGADFRTLLIPLFNRAALSAFKNNIDQAMKRFTESMRIYVLTAQPTLSLYGNAGTEAATPEDKLQPPLSLMEFQPLAIYCNNVLTAFNELRLCASFPLAVPVSHILQQSLVVVSSTIAGFHKTEESVVTAKEREHLTRLCERFAFDLVPYINICLEALFPPEQLSQQIGLGLSQLRKQAGMGSVDVPTVLEPLNHLLPQFEEEIPKEDEVNELPEEFEKTVNLNESLEPENEEIPEDGGPDITETNEETKTIGEGVENETATSET